MMDNEHLAERREEILSAAEKLFDANGYAATTMDAVAAEAGVSKGSIYNYFKNKQDLFAQVVAAAMAGDEVQIDQTLSSPVSATAKLNQLLDNWWERLEHYRRIGRLMLEFWATAARQDQEEELSSWFEQQYIYWREKIAPLIAQGIASGEFDRSFPPEVAASLIMAMTRGITVQSILDMGVDLDGDFLEAIKRIILSGLSSRAEPQ